ncbi:hypothetical protein ACFQZX_14455 [Mucilaginibacter litoreus]|uniref:Lipoprotein n=1 Tax=Mucilaginibacter litoreus TaxID=1048221 RepID=A0ABW3AVC8_9SPHI
MKVFKYIAAITILSASLAACHSDERSNATLGGTQDTVAKAGTGDPSNSRAVDSTKTDSTDVNKGNADPTGRGSSDTSDSRPVH